MSEQQLNTIQNLKTALSTKEIIAYLAEKFPLCFSLEGEAKPLKIGLFQDLVEALSNDEKISKTGLRQALRVYTMSWRYLHACKEGAVRVGLQG
ncbi:RNA chaperone ProQ, partial [Glaesserella parasuis]|nr:RNA chaperone ProQ [Glaesserella parasuis]